MRVAIVGANLLGSATAFYTRRALDENQAEGARNGDEEEDEIVVFEKRQRAGGNKLVTLKLGDVEACVGTAAGVDFGALPLVANMMKDAGLDLGKRKGGEWAIFDWDKDEYKLGRVRSRVFDGIRGSMICMGLLQMLGLLGMMYFWGSFEKKGFLASFVKGGRFRIQNGTFQFWRFLLFCGVCSIGGGIIPVGWLMRVYGWLYYRLMVDLTAGMTYGGENLGILGEVMRGFKEHLSLIVERNSGSSCVTLGHLLAASGLAKYAKTSTVETFAGYGMKGSLLDEVIGPGLSISYANSACKAGDKTNTLATLCNMLCRCPMPISFRWRSGRYLGAQETKGICKGLIEKGGGQLKLGVEVRSVKKTGDGKYAVMGMRGSGKVENLGVFDAVVLAAVVDKERFDSDAIDGSVEEIFALGEGVSGMPAGDVQISNLARYVAVIEGELNPEYFKKRNVNGVAEHVTVLKSVNCAEICKVGDGVYRVVCGEKPEKGSKLGSTVFKEIYDVKWIEREKRKYYATPMRNLDGAEAPDFILGTRFLNAACVDRVGNDANLDVLSARNTGSFFRNGVATWK